ncbi:MAG: class I SAM-dependent rRNA methyltransferase [Nitrospirae bacterium]|nr:class I SAM-dependent rRNA methyltransferase [Nitrospirota bacterium]
MKTLRLKKKEDRRIRRGHPWVFSNEVETPLPGFEPGEPVVVEDYLGKPVGTGYVNPRSLIAVRLVSRKVEEVGPELIRERVLAARAFRDRLYPGRDTYRAFYSESDFLPGLVVDRYAGWLSVQSLTAGMERMMPMVLDVLGEVYGPDGIVLRNDSKLREMEGLPLVREAVRGTYDGPVEAGFAGLRMMVDLMEGQKTGFFLDQVDNYSLLGSISEGAKALDLFCHTGAWAISAMKAGAAEVTGVDSSAQALGVAYENAGLNGAGDSVEFVKSDVFDYLKGLGGRRFDVVVVDPPAFVKSRTRIAEGLKGYTDLNVRAMKAVRPGGFMVSCSCSHHVDRETFREMLRLAASGAGRTVRLLEMRSQSRDHPVLLAVPETEYLKCALVQVL